MKKILTLAAIGTFIFACNRTETVESGDSSSGLSSIKIGKPVLSDDSIYSTAAIEINCIDCEASLKEGVLVNESVAKTEKMEFTALMASIANNQYTEGTQLTIDLEFYNEAGETVLDTCEGTAPGCSEYTHLLALDAATGSFKVTVKLKDLSGNPVLTGDESSDLIIDPVVEGADGVEGDVKVELTSEAGEAIELDDHCIVEYLEGMHAGQMTADGCVISFGVSPVVVSEGIQYLKANDKINFLFIPKADLVDQKIVVVGSETRQDMELPMYVCKAGGAIGKTSIMSTGGAMWNECHVGVDAAGNELIEGALIADFEILVYEIVE